MNPPLKIPPRPCLGDGESAIIGSGDRFPMSERGAIHDATN